MTSKTQARPYAQAIFDHSEGWREDLQQIVGVLKEGSVARLIDSPKLAYREKAEIFVGLFDGEVQKKTLNFLKILGEAKRLSLLPDILSEYQKLEADKNNLKEVLISSAFELNQTQEEAIEGLLKKRYGENLSSRINIDKSLIGGLTVKCGDEVIDLSTKGRLLKLKKQIS